ncbi:MAG: hypothetical protein PHV63_04620 [Candidatus Daviesbacteria bacterium]|nr:hypothetical protein [Candidatus Daviesbacteria bacterium]
MNTNTKNLIKDSFTDKPVPAILLDIKEFLSQAAVGDDPIAVIRDLQEELKDTEKVQDATREGKLYKAMTLLEFEKGTLMMDVIPNKYRTFCIDFSRNLQREHHCEHPSEKATAELVALNFVRVLEIQDKINTYFADGGVTEARVKYLAVLSKDLDRANRHYLNALQTLKMLKQPPLEVNIKTQTAIVGQNQIVQSNNDKAK